MNIVVLAGIPSQIEKEFARNRERIFPKEQYELVWSPIKSYTYTDEYVNLLYTKLWETLCAVYKSNSRMSRLDISLILLYVDYKDETVDKLTLAFLPEALPIPILQTVEPINRQPRNKIRAAANQLLSSMNKAMKLADKALPAIKKEVTSNDNKTPILLPVHNFGRDEVVDFLQEVCVSALTNDDPFKAIKDTRIQFENKYPKIKLGKGARNHFQNKVGIVFKSPGTDRHGEAGLRHDEHRKTCFVRSRLRLGATFDPGFHYDCVKPKGTFPSMWKSCHQQDFHTPNGKDHVNIAPNDYVRK